MFSDDGYETEILILSCFRVENRELRSGDELPMLVDVLCVLPLLSEDSWYLEPRPRWMRSVKRCSSNLLPIPLAAAADESGIERTGPGEKEEKIN